MQSVLLTLVNETATEELAQSVAVILAIGDVIRLEGNLGAGKSTFARALLRAMGTKIKHIPSPTYTLMQPYDDTCIPVAHLDCYRLSADDEVMDMELETYLRKGIVMAEWPTKNIAHTSDKAGTLTIKLAFNEDSSVRTAKITGTGTWKDRLQSLQQ